MDDAAIVRELARIMATMELQGMLTTNLAKLVLAIVNSPSFDLDQQTLGVDLEQMTYEMQRAMVALQRLGKEGRS